MKVVWGLSNKIFVCQGSELIFTLFHRPDMSDEKFAEDAEWVKRDFNVLKNYSKRNRRGISCTSRLRFH